ncbi:MAG: LemA family protein [Bdellovibrionales bacterium]
MGVIIAVLVVLALFLIFSVSIYNGLVRLKNQVQRAWANIDVILKQRFDEIPQLVQVIEQYANYEAGIIKKLAEARAHYGSAQSVAEKIKSSTEMSLALSGVMAISEAYPELKANQNFINLQTRVSSLETTLSDRRETYNEVVTNFNTRIEQFPDVIVARILGYQEQTLFQVTEAEKQKPNLKMDLPKF